MDMSKFIIPKSDQLNADDLIGGPRTVTITRVAGVEGDQPVSVYYEGDNGKPYKPCKSMRRVMVHCWGRDAIQYAGRSMTLYCDPKVQFGGMQVGGIRISHMSHITEKKQMALTATRGKRAPFVVHPLTDAPQTQTQQQRTFDAELASLKAATSLSELETAWGGIGADARKALAGELPTLKAALPPPQQTQDDGDVGFNDDAPAQTGGYDGV